MATARRKISAGEAAQIAKLESRLGSVRLRSLLSDTGGSSRLVRPERASRWRAGRGTLSEEERQRLALVNSNANSLTNLARKRQGGKEARVNRALKDWLLYGKEKGEDTPQDPKSQDDRNTALRALGYFGVDPSEGTYYVRKRAA